MKSLAFLRFATLSGCAMTLLLCGCASGPDESAADSSSTLDSPMGPEEATMEDDLFYGDLEETGPHVDDPLEPFNRAMFKFNDVVYSYLLSPVAKGYDFVAPEPVQRGIGNFFNNLRMPVHAVNALLQGKTDRAAEEVASFLVDSTAGMGGLMRPSETVFGTNPEEDLGQTFAYWGADNGPYLVLPLLGPTTARDGLGRVGDVFLDPLTYYDEEWEISWGLRGLEFTNELPDLTDRYQSLKDAAVDPYISLRDAYLSNRRKEVDR